MITQQIPVTATFYGGTLPAYLQTAIAGEQKRIAEANSQRTTNFNAAVTQWLSEAAQDRLLNHGAMTGVVNVPPKPVCEPLYQLMIVPVQAQVTPADGDTMMTVVLAQAPIQPLGVYFYEAPLPVPVCPDLPSYEPPQAQGITGLVPTGSLPVGAPTIITVDVLKQQTDSAGHLWLRLS